METNRQRISRIFDDIRSTLSDYILDFTTGEMSEKDFLASIQKLSERAGLNFYDAYWNILTRPDDLIGACLDLYREIRREIPKSVYATWCSPARRPGAAEAHWTTQEGMMTV